MPCEIHVNEEQSEFHRGRSGRWYGVICLPCEIRGSDNTMYFTGADLYSQIEVQRVMIWAILFSLSSLLFPIFYPSHFPTFPFFGLIGILIGIPPKHREPENLQIKPEAPVFQIKNVMLHTLYNRSVPAPSVHLCPAGHWDLVLPKTALS